MKWNLRMAAARRDIWKASQLQGELAAHGLVISAGKMSGLWSGQPISLKLDDLDVICAVLDCEIGELLTPEPHKVTRPRIDDAREPLTADHTGPNSGLQPGPTRPTVVPRRRGGRSVPPS